MDNSENVKHMPILPFDGSYGENFRIYNEVYYTRDLTLMPDEPVKLESGNLVKYYRCDTKKPVMIGGH